MKLIIANWKSNKNLSEAKTWLNKAIPALKDAGEDIIICPPLPFIPTVLEIIKNSNLKIGIQDLSSFPAGSYTGAVGTKNLEDLNISYAIVGHSERRRYFHETNSDVANKVREALLADIKPIVCVTKDTIIDQAHALEKADKKNVIVAFEPIANIGTGIADSLDDILKTKKLVLEAFGDVPYVYGGSVDLNTELELLAHDEIDGFLVGTASLDADTFIKLVSLIK